MTTTPVLPEEAAYGIKSEYGFDQKNGHKQLIGVSVGRPGSWAGARVVELYTADQMRDYALAAIAAAQAAQPTDAERWFKWQGDYEKQSYDVWISGSDVVLGCWPSAGYMAATDGSGRQWLPGAVLAVRVSAYQGRFPKPKFDAAIAASKGAA